MQLFKRKPQLKLQKNFTASKKPSPKPLNEKVLSSWETNFTNLQNHWRSILLNARNGKGEMDLNSIRAAFFRARFDFIKQLRQHSNLPHNTILEFEKRMEQLSNELKGNE